MTTTESLIERDLIAKLEDLKYTYRPDIRDRAALGQKLLAHLVARQKLCYANETLN